MLDSLSDVDIGYHGRHAFVAKQDVSIDRQSATPVACLITNSTYTTSIHTHIANYLHPPVATVQHS